MYITTVYHYITITYLPLYTPCHCPFTAPRHMPSFLPFILVPLHPHTRQDGSTRAGCMLFCCRLFTTLALRPDAGSTTYTAFCGLGWTYLRPLPPVLYTRNMPNAVPPTTHTPRALHAACEFHPHFTAPRCLPQTAAARLRAAYTRIYRRGCSYALAHHIHICVHGARLPLFCLLPLHDADTYGAVTLPHSGLFAGPRHFPALSLYYR